ncbi:MAG: hypothetical protein IE926_19240 [Micrococcales bacterium]|nr:hypothetical protein [Micrococcales bacterium]
MGPRGIVGGACALVVAVVLSACQSSTPTTSVGTSRPATSPSAVVTRLPTEDFPGATLLAAPRAALTVSIPEGWDTVTREQATAMDDAELADLERSWRLTEGFLTGLARTDSFELYAIDHDGVDEVRVLWLDQKVLATKDAFAAVARSLGARVVDSAAIATPVGYQAVAHVVENGTADPAFYGSVVMALSGGGTTFLVALSDSSEHLRPLEDRLVRGLAPRG